MPGTSWSTITDGNVKFPSLDEKAEQSSNKVGDAVWSDAVSHLPESLEAQPLEAILIEIK